MNALRASPRTRVFVAVGLPLLRQLRLGAQAVAHERLPGIARKIAVLRMDLNSIRRGGVGSEGAVASGLMRRSVKRKSRHSANGYNRQ